MNGSHVINEFKRYNELSLASVQAILENDSIKIELLDFPQKDVDRAFALCLLQWFVQLRKEEHGVSSDDLVFAALLLGRHGQVQDCLCIWEAKECDFDTRCGLDIQTMMFAGVEHTIAFLRGRKDEQGQRALRYVMECLEAGNLDDLDTYFKEISRFWRPAGSRDGAL